MDRKRTKFFFKANNDVLSHCSCENVPAMSTGQLDCPWCGCGWMISCSKCTKSFVFAEVRETDLTLMELGRAEVRSRGLKNISDADIAEWAGGMRTTLDYFEVGDVVVYLDGNYWAVDAEKIDFDGYHAHHELDRLPHVEALADPASLNRILGDPQYWYDRELPDRE